MTVSVSATTPHFEFGANWREFLTVLTPERIARAESSLAEMLGTPSLTGKRFLDVGCGSGLFSLAARRMGAEVVSFDFDPLSVACAEELKRVHAPDDASWRIAQGSVIDPEFMRSLGTFDVVYSWGVLHHTGSMWAAVDQTCQAVGSHGWLFVALYNDQGPKSAWWASVKRTYNTLPRIFRSAVPARLRYSSRSGCARDLDRPPSAPSLCGQMAAL